jgi:hypothetical protein
VNEKDPGFEILSEMETESGLDPRDLRGDESSIAKIRSLLLNDSFAFNWFIFEHRDLTESVHGEICNILNVWGLCELDDGTWTDSPGDNDVIITDYRRIMVQIPREFFKTSVATRANSLWQVCRDPNKTIVIFNERLDNCKKWVRGIREVVENSLLFQVIFEDLLPPGIAAWDTRTMGRSWKWSDESLLFQRSAIGIPEASITGLGIGAASAGGHWHKVIKDDIISEDAVRSPNEMAAAKEWFDKSLYLERPAMKGMDLIACTPWMYGDVYDKILEEYNYLLYRRSALEDVDGLPDRSGQSIFPEKLTTKELRKQYDRDPMGFWSQMMCYPKVSDEISFNEDWFRAFSGPVSVGAQQCAVIDYKHFDPTISESEEDAGVREVPMHWIERAILLDPAGSKKSQQHAQKLARNGLICAGKDPYGRRFCFEAQAFRSDPEDTLRRVIDMVERWQTYLIAIEEVTFSEVYRPFLKYIIKKEYPHLDGLLRVVPVSPQGRPKDKRNEAMIPFMRQGFHYFIPENTQPILSELAEYPNGLTVDTIDAYAYLDDVVTRPESPTELEQSHYEKILRGSGMSGRDEVTGY